MTRFVDVARQSWATGSHIFGATVHWLDESVAVVSVTGEVDLATAPTLTDALDHVLTHGPGLVIVDLSGVEFLASAGLSFLVSARHRIGQTAQFHLVGNAIVRRTLDLTGLTSTFVVFGSLDDALASPPRTVVS